MIPIVQSSPNECWDYAARNFGVCIPYLGPCRPKTGSLFTECDNAYNCRKCRTQPQFFMPVLRGDKIYIQTNFTDFENVDIDPPTRGFGDFIIATLCTDSAPDETNHILFSTQYGVGYNGRDFYQQIVIDTSMLIFDGVTCFSLKFEIFGSGDPEEVIDLICTEPFSFIGACFEDDTSLIESIYSPEDCNYGYYGDFDSWLGTTEFRHRNLLRFWAKPVFVGVQSTRRQINSMSEINTKGDVYELTSTRVHAEPGIKLLNEVLNGSNVTINGVGYTIPNYNTNSVRTYRISVRQECTSVRC